MKNLIALNELLDEAIELGHGKSKKAKKDKTTYQVMQNQKTGKTARIPMKRNWLTGVYSPNQKHPEYSKAMKTLGILR